MVELDKNILSQLRHLKNEIELLKNQIENMRYDIVLGTDIVSDSVKGSDTSFPYTEHTIVITGIEGRRRHEQKLNNLRKKLAHRVDELMDLVDEVTEYIQNINDSLIRQILTLRYINGLTWRQVAAHIGGGNTEDSVRKAHDRFLQKN